MSDICGPSEVLLAPSRLGGHPFFLLSERRFLGPFPLWSFISSPPFFSLFNPGIHSETFPSFVTASAPASAPPSFLPSPRSTAPSSYFRRTRRPSVPFFPPPAWVPFPAPPPSSETLAPSSSRCLQHSLLLISPEHARALHLSGTPDLPSHLC